MSRGKRRLRDFWSAGKRIRRVYVHRLVVERVLGRELLTTETVHHINGNPSDNRLDNLILFSSQSAHMLYHNYNWRAEDGALHLFEAFDHVRALGGSVIWATDSGLREAFGDDWRRVRQAMPDTSREDHPIVVDHNHRNNLLGTKEMREWLDENVQVVPRSSKAA